MRAASESPRHRTTTITSGNRPADLLANTATTERMLSVMSSLFVMFSFCLLALLTPASSVHGQFCPSGRHRLADPSPISPPNLSANRTPTHESVYPGQYPSLWHEAGGLGYFDAVRHLLHHSLADSLSTPLIWESGPLTANTPVNRRWFRFDLNGIILGSLRWHPGRLPLDLVESDPNLDSHNHFRWRLETGFLFNLPPGWTCYGRAIVDSDRSADPTARITEYDEIEASIEIPTAAIRYQNGPFLIQAGRRWRQWGPGWTGSLVLGNHHPSTDGCDLAYTAEHWSARYFFVRLDGHMIDSPADSGPLDRYLAAHRLDFQPHPGWRFGLTETALVATEGTPPFWALNPLLPWALVQQEGGASEETVNIMWSADGTWNPHRGWSCYFQFLLDDYQIDREDRDVHPDQLGWLVGIAWQQEGRSAGSATEATGHAFPGQSAHTAPEASVAESPAVPSASVPQHPTHARRNTLGFGLEYTRIATWTYIHRDPPARYRAWDAPLGHPLGPDSEAVSGYAEWRRLGGRWRLLLFMQWLRHGSIALDTAESPTGHAHEPFPSPPVSKSTQLTLVAAIRGPANCLMEGRVGWIGRSGDRASTNDRDGYYAILSFTCPLWIAPAAIP